MPILLKKAREWEDEEKDCGKEEEEAEVAEEVEEEEEEEQTDDLKSLLAKIKVFGTQARGDGKRKKRLDFLGGKSAVVREVVAVAEAKTATARAATVDSEARKVEAMAVAEVAEAKAAMRRLSVGGGDGCL